MMNISLYNKSFLSLLDFTANEIYYLLDLATKLKLKRKQGIPGNLLQGKNIALLFEKTSTRTRSAFEIGVIEEGGYPSFIDISSSQFGKKESVEDSAKVLAGYFHAIEFRGYAQKTVEDLAKYSGIPVYNGLTDEDHPTQILADLLTIQEKLPHKPLSEIKVAYIGDTRNNMANAWMYGCAKLGMHFVGFGPQELHPKDEFMNKALAAANKNGAKIEISSDPLCLKNADVIYTDVWVSMGEEHELQKRASLLKDYKITPELMNATQNPNTLFMHCLPAFHDDHTLAVKKASEEYGIDIKEVSDEVFRSKNSIVFEQAENRLHTIKALLVATLSPLKN